MPCYEYSEQIYTQIITSLAVSLFDNYCLMAYELSLTITQLCFWLPLSYAFVELSQVFATLLFVCFIFGLSKGLPWFLFPSSSCKHKSCLWNCSWPILSTFSAILDIVLSWCLHVKETVRCKIGCSRPYLSRWISLCYEIV